jgi:hypothetical protein
MIRPLQPADRPRVLEISAGIWEGDDYISAVFDQWITQDNGEFTGYFHGDTLVGFSKLTMLTPQDAWLEGMRKDQSTTITGVANALTSYHLRKISAIADLHSIRFSTYFGNTASIISAEKNGFERILTVSLKNGDVKQAEESPSELRNDVEFEQLRGFVERSEYLRQMQHFWPRGWVVHPYRTALLHDSWQGGNYCALVQDDQIVAAAVFYTGAAYADELWISWLQAPDADIYAMLLQAARALAWQQGKQIISLLEPGSAPLRAAIDLAGMYSWEQDDDFMIYELPLARFRSQFGGGA